MKKNVRRDKANFYENDEGNLKHFFVRQSKKEFNSFYHICKYCGVYTWQDDELCYKKP